MLYYTLLLPKKERNKIIKSNPCDPLILLTNDDGFFSEGIQVLKNKLSKNGQVYIVAPDNEKSATSLALTLHHPLRVKKIDSHTYAVSGTPADCIYLATQNILPSRPDLIISGMNPGPNLGQQDISYSGTVAGAIQGTFLDIPSIAVSTLSDDKGRFYFDFSANFILSLTRQLIRHPIPKGVTLNINIPSPPINGIKITKLGQKRYHPEIISKKDPRKRDYYWIGTGMPKAMGDKNSDVNVIQEGYITVTPLHRDMTDYDILKNNDLTDLFKSTKYEFS
jgi:5'-nucleotidase